MQVSIISPKYDNIIKYIAENARICYGREYQEEKTNSENLSTVSSLLTKGHHSVFECIYIEWYVKNISRAATHQIVRHRIASYLQQSQRYCKYDVESSDGFWNNMVTPELDYLDKTTRVTSQQLIEGFLTTVKTHYKNLLKLGVKPEDARCILPNCSPTTIKIGMNLREFLFNFLPLRSSNHAQEEIRTLALNMLGELRLIYKDDKSFDCFMDMYKVWINNQHRPEWKRKEN